MTEGEANEAANGASSRVSDPSPVVGGTASADRDPIAPAPPSEGAAKRGRAWQASWPVRLGALALIGVAIWSMQSGAGLPLIGGGSQEPAQQAGTDGFVTFGSQGIKLGAAEGVEAKIGQPAPDFALLDPSGRVVRLSDFRGKTVVMNFWATWCGPCRKEFPLLVKVYEQNKAAGLIVLGVDLQENPAAVRGFAEEFGARFPIVIDSEGSVGPQYRLLGLPTTYFIDAEGAIRAQHIGELTEGILTGKLRETGFTVSRGQ